MGEPARKLEGSGMVVGKRAPDFLLGDHQGGEVGLYHSLGVAPALIAFYPGDMPVVCTQQLCNYRDNIEEFNKYGLQIFGISHNSREHHKKYAERYKFPFLLLSDPGNVVAKSFGCTSALMLGGVSRAVFIVNTQGLILYRYVEPTVLTRRSADELIAILGDLKKNNLI